MNKKSHLLQNYTFRKTAPQVDAHDACAYQGARSVCTRIDGAVYYSKLVAEWFRTLQYISVPEWLRRLQYISVPEWLRRLQYISMPEWLMGLQYISVRMAPKATVH